MSNVGRMAAVPWQRIDTGSDDSRQRWARADAHFCHARATPATTPTAPTHFPIVAAPGAVARQLSRSSAVKRQNSPIRFIASLCRGQSCAGYVAPDGSSCHAPRGCPVRPVQSHCAFGSSRPRTQSRTPPCRAASPPLSRAGEPDNRRDCAPTRSLSSDGQGVPVRPRRTITKDPGADDTALASDAAPRSSRVTTATRRA
jgi:hypothetical protein